MKRILAGLIACIAFASCAGSQVAGTQGANASQAPVGTVASQAPTGSASAAPGASQIGAANVQVVKTYLLTFKSSIGGGGVQMIVAVKNIGGGVAQLGGTNSESWTLYAKDGSVLATGDLTPAPQFLSAGETGYLVGWTNLNDNASFAQVAKADPSVTFSAVDSIPTQNLTTANVTARAASDGIWMQASGTVTNNGTATVVFGSVIVVLFGASGTPIGFLQDSQAATGLIASQKKGFSTEDFFVPAPVAPKVKSIKVYVYELQL